METQKRAFFYAALAVLLWSTVASAFKISLRYLDSFQLLFLASIASTTALYAILRVQGKHKLLKSYSMRDYTHSALQGFLNPFLYYLALFKAYSLLPAQLALPLNYTWPIMLALLSIPLLKEKTSLKSLVGLGVSFIGVYLVAKQDDVTQAGSGGIWGVALALGSALIWSLFWIYATRDRRDEAAKLFLNFVFGSLYITIALGMFDNFTVPPGKGVLGAVYIGLFEMGFTFIVWSKALKLSSTTARVSNIVYLTPFFSLVFVHFVVGERILAATFIGLCFIVSGIAIGRHNGNGKTPGSTMPAP